jgi:hypothetical protein
VILLIDDAGLPARVHAALADGALNPAPVHRRDPPSCLDHVPHLRKEYEQRETEHYQRRMTAAAAAAAAKVPPGLRAVVVAGEPANYPWPHPGGVSSCLWDGERIVANPALPRALAGDAANCESDDGDAVT